MASYKDHCSDCKDALGYEFFEVNEWLDELYRYMPRNFKHRSFRHHKEGIEVCRKKWGDQAAEAAKIHIMRDFPGLKEPPYAKDYEDPKLIEKADFMMDEIPPDIRSKGDIL